MTIETSREKRAGVYGVRVTLGAFTTWLTGDEAADLAADLIAPDAAPTGGAHE